MRFIGFSISKISAEREVDLKEMAAIDTNIDFKEITEEKLKNLNNMDAVKILFDYTISYQKKDNKSNVASIKILGDVIFTGEKEEFKSLISGWKKKNIPIDLKVPIFNMISNKCVPKAISLQDQLNIPPHIPFPSFINKSSGKN